MAKPDVDEARALTELQRVELAECERKIEAGLQTFYDVGTALAQIRDRGLYKDTYRTFPEYCEQKWDMTASRAYQHIDAAKVVDVLKATDSVSTVVEIAVLPAAESQVRDLVPLIKKPGKVREVWRRAVALADGKTPTAAKVGEARSEVFPKVPKQVPKQATRPAPSVKEPAASEQELADQLLGGKSTSPEPDVLTGPVVEEKRVYPGSSLSPEQVRVHLCGLTKQEFTDLVATVPAFQEIAKGFKGAMADRAGELINVSRDLRDLKDLVGQLERNQITYEEFMEEFNYKFVGGAVKRGVSM